MTLEERIEKLEQEIKYLQSEISGLNKRTTGQMMIGPGCISPLLDGSSLQAKFTAFSDKAIKEIL